MGCFSNTQPNNAAGSYRFAIIPFIRSVGGVRRDVAVVRVFVLLEQEQARGTTEVASARRIREWNHAVNLLF